MVLKIGSYRSSNITKDFKSNDNILLVHEHDFEPIKTKEGRQKLIICFTCESLYCEMCGKPLISTSTIDVMVNNYGNKLSIITTKE